MKLDQKWVEKWKPCRSGKDWLEKEDNRDSVIVLKKLIKEDHLDWANWAIVRIMKRKQYLAYAIFAAERVIDIYEKKHPGNDKPRKAIEAAKNVLKRDTKKNRAAADAAADAAYAAADAAAYAAAYAAYAAADAAAYAAYDARKKMRIKILNYGIKILGEK